ncbi:MAG: hypothetical protein JWQ65_1737, partial [Devosia sp.]|nr:hypothetical protein [Devosia sp.]
MVDQEAHPAWLDIALRVDNLQPSTAGRVISQNFDQRAGRQILLHVTFRFARNTKALLAPLAHQPAIIGNAPSANRYRTGLSVDTKWPFPVNVLAKAHDDAVMPGQLVRMLRRTMGVQIGGRGTDEAPVFADGFR